MDVSAQLVDVFDAVVVHELMEGEQSHAFRMVGADGSISVVKLLDASMADRAELDVRLVVTNGLADIDARVCRPLPTHGDLAVELTDADGHNWYVVRYEFAAGRPLNPGNAQDATSMGTALSELHSSMSRLAPVSLPLVAALRTAPRDAITAGARPHQLLHGDFNASNLRESDGMVRIFDFDDCGYGPTEFDVANALYMVLFDAVTQGDTQTYAVFRPSFLAGYVSSSGVSLEDELLDRFLELRVEALRAWLDDLDNAPIGIRTASPSWHEVLRSFVNRH